MEGGGSEHWCKNVVEQAVPGSNQQQTVTSNFTSTSNPPYYGNFASLYPQNNYYPQYYPPQAGFIPGTVNFPSTAPSQFYAAGGTYFPYTAGTVYSNPNYVPSAAPPTFASVAAKPPAINVKRASVTPGVVATPVVTATSSSSSSVNSATWPASLKKYVKHAFEQCVTDDDRTFVGSFMKDLIARVSNDNRLNVHKWELEPLPSLPSKGEDASTGTVKKRNRFAYSAEEAAKSAVSITPSSGMTVGLSDLLTSSAKNKKKLSHINALLGHSSSDNLELLKSPKRVPDSPSAKKPASIVVDDVDEIELSKRREREERFEQDRLSLKRQQEIANAPVKTNKKAKLVNTGAVIGTVGSLSEEEIAKLMIVGTCSRVEKDYFRLTSAPAPNTIRPLPVLIKALKLLKDKWESSPLSKERGFGVSAPAVEGGVDYIYMCSQLKAIRQDITVQHIKNDLCVQVYEFHAKVALQCNDLNEYNQCQTQLKQLYATIGGANEHEFIAYRLLYYVYLQYNRTAPLTSADMTHVLRSLSPAALKNPAIIHALNVRKTLCVQKDFFNYHQFFKLFAATPNLGNCILKLIMESVRLQACYRIVKSFRLSISVKDVLKEIGFDNGNHDQLLKGVEYLKSVGSIFVPPEDAPPQSPSGIAKIPKKGKGALSRTQQLEQFLGMNINCKDTVVVQPTTEEANLL